MRGGLVTMSALLGLAALSVCASAGAHHSFHFFFDTSKWVTIEGTVTKVFFQNPHVGIELEVAREDGTTETWAVETNHRAGIEREVSIGDPWLPSTVQPGDEVVVEGHPARREGSAAIHALGIMRSSDGWRWAWRLENLPEERRGDYR